MGIPGEPPAHNNQKAHSPPLVQVQEEPLAATSGQEQTIIHLDSDTQTQLNEEMQPNQPTEPNALDEIDVEQQTQPRRSLRGGVPIREWKACPFMDRSETDNSYIPLNYQDAMNCPAAKNWKIATQEEYQSLIDNGTWSIVSCPKDRTPIKSRWTFDIKPGLNGEPQRFKARFVAKGYSQRPRIDFNETYASVVSHDTLRILLSVIAADDLEALQIDVKTAFLYGPLEEEIFMDQPEGFVIPGQESKVCRLHKCIYGLKQASRVWGDLFTDFIEHHGFQRSEADPCLFSRVRGTERTFLTTWVDDVIVASNQQQAIDGFLIALGEKFQFRSHPLQRYVGITIARDREQRKLHISKPEYISQIVKKFHMASCSPKSIPADPNAHLVKPTEEKEEENAFPYREAVGALLYLALVSRPDISFAVGQVARFVESYNLSHVKAVRQIISYIHGTPNHGICFAGSNRKPLVGFSDADYAGCQTTRRSTTGNVFMYNGGIIAWCSSRQTCVAMSTTEAEYVAASETAKEAIWIRRILPIFQQGPEAPIVIKCDNQSAIQLVCHPDQRPKTKHIAIRYNFIRLQQENGEIKMEFTRSADQLADIMTKALPSPRFHSIREELSVVPGFI